MTDLLSGKGRPRCLLKRGREQASQCGAAKRFSCSERGASDLSRPRLRQSSTFRTQRKEISGPTSALFNCRRWAQAEEYWESKTSVRSQLRTSIRSLEDPLL